MLTASSFRTHTGEADAPSTVAVRAWAVHVALFGVQSHAGSSLAKAPKHRLPRLPLPSAPSRPRTTPQSPIPTCLTAMRLLGTPLRATPQSHNRPPHSHGERAVSPSPSATKAADSITERRRIRPRPSGAARRLPMSTASGFLAWRVAVPCPARMPSVASGRVTTTGRDNTVQQPLVCIQCLGQYNPNPAKAAAAVLPVRRPRRPRTCPAFATRYGVSQPSRRHGAWCLAGVRARHRQHG